MNFIFVFLGMTTLIVFLFKREWLLEKDKAIFIFIWNVFLFISSYFLLYIDFGDPDSVLLLRMSLITHLIFIFLVIIFKKIVGRNPVDTFWVSDKKLFIDGAFNFLFWFLGIVLPMTVIFKI